MNFKYWRMLQAALAILLLLPGAASAGAASPPPELSHLSLADAEALWLAHSRELKLARGAVEGAEADAVTAGQRPNPQLSAQVSSLSRNPGIGSGGWQDKQMDTTVGISQLFERGGKREFRTQGAQSRLEASRQDYSDTLRNQRMVLRQTYYDLLLAQDKSRVAEENAALYQKTVEAAQLRLRAGDISPTELTRIRVEAGRARNDARQAANDLTHAQLALAYLIGREGSAKAIRGADAWPAPAATKTSEVDIDGRPDVKAALSRVQAAEAARDLARSLRTRDVTVGLSFDHNPTGSSYATNSYGIAVSVPLMVNYGYDGEIRRAEADLDVARNQLEQVRAVAVADVARARDDLDSAAQRARRYDEGLLDDAERAARAAEFAYKNGAMGLMDLLDVRRTYKVTQIEAAAARADYAKALAAWHAAAVTEEDK